MKKILIKLSIITYIFLLTGCHMHSWEKATCTEPKICSECGKIKGEPLGHDLSKPSYQSPSICKRCNEKIGEPLKAAMDSFKLIEDKNEYDYNTACNRDKSKNTVAKISIIDYKTVESDSDYELKEGYEWKIANVKYVFSDENAREYGYTFSADIIDYYKGLDTEKISYNNKDYETFVKFKELKNIWEKGKANVILEVAVNVPKGYDGSVICIYNTKNKDYASFEDLSKANALYYRMK